MCGIVRISLIKSLDSTTDSTCKFYIDFSGPNLQPIDPPTGNGVALGEWTFAESSVGIIAGSIPPCRAFVLQTLRKFRGEASPNGNTIVVPNFRSGRSYLLKSLSRVTNALFRSRASPKASGVSKGSKNSQKQYTSTNPWNRETIRAASQDSERESILLLHTARNASLETGIMKTVDVRVGTGEDDIGLATNEST